MAKGGKKRKVRLLDRSGNTISVDATQKLDESKSYAGTSDNSNTASQLHSSPPTNDMIIEQHMHRDDHQPQSKKQKKNKRKKITGERNDEGDAATLNAIAVKEIPGDRDFTSGGIFDTAVTAGKKDDEQSEKGESSPAVMGLSSEATGSASKGHGDSTRRPAGWHAHCLGACRGGRSKSGHLRRRFSFRALASTLSAHPASSLPAKIGEYGGRSTAQDPEAAETPPGPSPQRWARDDRDGELEIGAPQRKRQRMTSSSALPAPSSIDVEEGEPSTVGPEDTASEEASYASLASCEDVQQKSPSQERPRQGKTHGKSRSTEPGATRVERPPSQSSPPGSSRGDAVRQGAIGGGTSRDSTTTTLTPGEPGQRKARKHTLSIALPGSVVENAQSRELKTYLVGEIARAAAIFEVDEIVVYEDQTVSRKGQGGVRDDSVNSGGGGGGDGSSGGGGDKNNPNVFMARLLQYAETPQYLRKQLFPMHPSLRFAGLLNPLDAPHHMRADDDCPYREGVVVERPVKKGAGSFVHIGKRKEARIDRHLDTGVRVTVKLDQGDPSRKSYFGKAVAPSAPREELGLYWGYQTRLASGLADVIAGCPFKGGYDLTVGTSERGTVTVDSPTFALPEYRHVLMVFGGVQGIEATVDADETLQLPGSDASALFDMWVNTCPGQGSRTIRTEEAVLITLARLRPHVLNNGGQS